MTCKVHPLRSGARSDQGCFFVKKKNRDPYLWNSFDKRKKSSSVDENGAEAKKVRVIGREYWVGGSEILGKRRRNLKRFPFG